MIAAHSVVIYALVGLSAIVAAAISMDWAEGRIPNYQRLRNKTRDANDCPLYADLKEALSPYTVARRLRKRAARIVLSRGGGRVYTANLKFAARKGMWVRIPPPAPAIVSESTAAYGEPTDGIKQNAQAGLRT